MAFTQAQRVKIRHYLGWSSLFVQFDSQLERAMNAIEQSADAVTQVTSMLTDLDTVETDLKAAYARLKALKVGSIELSGPGELQALRSEGRRIAGALAALVGVTVRHDVFSASSPTEFASRGGMTTTGGYLKIG